jgi:Ca2+-binding EF-hand superfamily protein
MGLTQQEIDGCREAFLSTDIERSGKINTTQLKHVLEIMGQKVSEADVFQIMNEVDDNMTGEIDFGQFLSIIEMRKERAENDGGETDMIDAFIACGGNADKSGNVRRETLIKIIKHDFGLPIDIEALINEIDADGSGEIEFEEFQELLS